MSPKTPDAPLAPCPVGGDAGASPRPEAGSLLRPTLRDVARAAGVSHMTVSRVARGERTVAAATAERVRAAMERLNYRPDPGLAALAYYRQRKAGPAAEGPAVSQKSTLAFLDCDPTLYSGWVLEGAREEAEGLGYLIERVELERDAGRQRRVSRELFHRGVRGLLFGPAHTPWVFGGWEWEHFAAVSLGALAHEPVLHSVCIDYFEGAFGGFQLLRKGGCRRIALAVPPELDARTGRRWLGGFAAAAKGALIRPLWWDGRAPLAGWLQKARADGVLTVASGAGDEARAFALARGLPMAFLSGFSPTPGVPRLSLDPHEIGVEGARLLHWHVLRHEFGLPQTPKRIALRGTWVAT